MKIAIFLFTFYTVFTVCSSQQLSRCCSAGRNHFESRSSCSGSMSASSSPTCKRASSICCLRALLDSKCEQGEKVANDTGSCPTALLGHLGGATHKECCDCCLLAKELSARGQVCVAPPSFSAACKAAFSRCCSTPFAFTYVAATQTVVTRFEASDRCQNENYCEQDCIDNGGSRVMCTCRQGYKLNRDARTCTAIRYCSPTQPCASGQRCTVDETGTSQCQRFDSAFDGINQCPVGYRSSPSSPGTCPDIDECLEDTPACTGENERCLNTPGSFECYCSTGYTWSEARNACIDMDECALGIDTVCEHTQRCVNTAGSYTCMRILNCGTGYYLDSINQTCNDIDECARGTHNCVGRYSCKNTRGSFRCEISRCTDGMVLDPRTRRCAPADCPVGYAPAGDGRCQDIDECLSGRRCATFQQCVNNPGSYKCVDQPNACGQGYKLDSYSGVCLDIDECATNSHSCGYGQACRNNDGGYTCDCPAGYDYNQETRTCDDIDECNRRSGSVCSLNARCENVPGSFRCHCFPGYTLTADGVTCEDLNECDSMQSVCEQRCINIPGSYQCICDRGYTLSPDGTTCEDIDECSLWQRAGEPLCMGGCINTAGSYTCRCPAGYEIQEDQRTCRDIDECDQGECQGDDNICVNTLGGFKCHHITCPDNYLHDPKYKNYLQTDANDVALALYSESRDKCLVWKMKRDYTQGVLLNTGYAITCNSRCNRPWPVCVTGDTRCMQSPISISYQFMALPRLRQFPATNPSIPLFTMKGPRFRTTEVQFELTLLDSRPERGGILPATRNSFLLQKGDAHNSVVIALKEPLDGPQDVKMELLMKVFHSGIFGGKAKAVLVVHVSHLVQDGFFCMKKCHPSDVLCLANHTLSISTQYAALPSTKTLRQPAEVTRVRAESLDRNPFSVEYVIDRANDDKFRVRQERNIGILILKEPILGPREVLVRLHMNVYSRTHVLVGHNIALIHVYVSKYNF